MIVGFVSLHLFIELQNPVRCAESVSSAARTIPPIRQFEQGGLDGNREQQWMNSTYQLAINEKHIAKIPFIVSHSYEATQVTCNGNSPLSAL